MKSKQIQKILEKIELPDFDIIATEEATWFTEALEHIEAILEDKLQ